MKGREVTSTSRLMNFINEPPSWRGNFAHTKHGDVLGQYLMKQQSERETNAQCEEKSLSFFFLLLKSL